VSINERKRYEKSKSSISKAQSHVESGEFWDGRDLSEVWNKTRKVKLEVVLEPEATYHRVEEHLAEKINQ
jgi:hypothetical protein